MSRLSRTWALLPVARGSTTMVGGSTTVMPSLTVLSSEVSLICSAWPLAASMMAVLSTEPMLTWASSAALFGEFGCPTDRKVKMPGVLPAGLDVPSRGMRMSSSRAPSMRRSLMTSIAAVTSALSVWSEINSSEALRICSMLRLLRSAACCAVSTARPSMPRSTPSALSRPEGEILALARPLASSTVSLLASRPMVVSSLPSAAFGFRLSSWEPIWKAIAGSVRWAMASARTRRLQVPGMKRGESPASTTCAALVCAAPGSKWRGAPYLALLHSPQRTVCSFWLIGAGQLA